MTPVDPALDWFHRRTSRGNDWPLERVLEAKEASGERITVVVPARDEAATVGQIVGGLRAELGQVVDEVVVMDSDSADATGEVARSAGAVVHRAAEVAHTLGSFPGKGEAIWKSLLVTKGDLLVFLDADLTVWSPDFVLGLVGPLLENPQTLLVKGFYQRPSPDGVGDEGGRVTELVVRPLVNLWWPELSLVVQPLAGEWSARRSLLGALPIPTGYGVELAVLLDTYERHGIDAVAQVDLGRRDHRHQPIRDLAVMAAELLSVAYRRGVEPLWPSAVATPRPVLRQYVAGDRWVTRQVPVVERPPADSVTDSTTLLDDR